MNKQRIKYIILLVLILLFIPSIIAIDDLIFLRYSHIDLKIPCIINSTSCDILTTCNITMFYPNGSILINNKEMEFNPTYFNYTLPLDDDYGTFSTLVYCNSSGLYGYSQFKVIISSTGNKVDDILAKVILYSIMGLSFLLIAFLIKEHMIMRYFFVLLGLLIIVLVLPATLLSDKLPLTMFKISNYAFYIILAYVLIYPLFFIIKYYAQKLKIIQDDNDENN